ncbi:hypothetical protein CR513_53508, partial [Mucuna pruriens]
VMSRALMVPSFEEAGIQGKRMSQEYLHAIVRRLALAMMKFGILKEKLNSEFKMKDLSIMKRIFGVGVVRNWKKKELFLSHHGYLKKVVEQFRMHESKLANTRLGHHTKLFVTQAPSTEEEISKMNSIPMLLVYDESEPSLLGDFAVGLRYLDDSIKSSLRYKKTTQGGDTIVGYVDANYVRNVDTRKSLFSLQLVGALSPTQGGYISLTKGVKEAIWLKGMVEVHIEKIASEDNLTYMFTKTLPRSKFKH